MKISYTWLQDYFKDTLPSIEELAETLTMKAYEVEGIEDGVLDIDILPNRSSDSLGYLGIAREVGVLLDQELKLPETKYDTNSSQKTSDFIALKVENERLVPRAMKRVVLDVKVGKSPKWLQDKLATMGQKSINNIVDVTNFVMWETGQPVHAFDLDKVKEGEIVVREAKEGEKVITLDGVEYELRKGMLVIADSKKALDIAAIKGGLASGIDENTKRVMLSVCNFNSTWIRKTSRALNLRTDASQRFESGITPEIAEGAMERLSQLIAELAEGVVLEEVLDNYPEKLERYKISVSLDEINKVLGSKMKDKEVKDILDRFSKHAGFEWREEDGKYVVGVPPQRVDLHPKEEKMSSGNKEDLIEEIGRVYGYENIESKLPEKLESKINKTFYYVELLKDLMVKNGFSEVITYSFQDKGEVRMANPLASDKKYLRNSLERGLSRALELNNKNKPLFGKSGVKIFEMGKVFEKDREYLSLGVATEDKGAINLIQLELEKVLGDKGQVKDNILVIDVEPEVLSEINSYKNLETHLTGTKEFQEISNYPFVLRDIAIWVPEVVGVGEVEGVIVDSAGEFLIKSSLFDTYEKNGKVSYAFNLVFQSNKKTLTDNEVGEIMSSIEQALKEQNWEVR